jgi:hypothetical protein
MVALSRLVDRRNHGRVPVGLTIVATFEGAARWIETDAELVDVSVGGMALRTDRRPRPGDRVSFELRLPGEQACTAAGRVVARRAGGACAVAFDAMTESMRRLLVALTDAAPELRRGLLAELVRPAIWFGRFGEAG